MKVRTVLNFDDREFYYQGKKGKKRIYQTAGINPTKLEISYENGNIKSINLIETTNGIRDKVIKIRVNSKHNIEITIDYKANEVVEIGDDLLEDMHVNYKKIYMPSGILKEERLSIISNKKDPGIVLKRLLPEKDQYIDKNKIVMTVNTEKLRSFEKYSDLLIEEFIRLPEKFIIKQEKTDEETEMDIIEDDPTILPPKDSYMIPSNIHIYDRIYSLVSSTVNHLKYINTDEENHHLEITLDHYKQKIKKIVFVETKPKSPTEKQTKKSSGKEGLHDKGNIIKLIPLEDGNIKGLYTSKKEDIKVDGKTITKTKTNAEGLYVSSTHEVESFVEISLNSGKLRVHSTPISYMFEDTENSYYITSRSHAKFTHLLGMSPYIIKSVEDKIWVKTK